MNDLLAVKRMTRRVDMRDDRETFIAGDGRVFVVNGGWQPIERAPISTPLEQQWFWGYAPDAPYGYGPDGRQHICVRYEWGCKVHGSNNDQRVTHWKPFSEPPTNDR